MGQLNGARYQYSQTPVFTCTANGDTLISAHINGLVAITQQNGQKQEINLNAVVLDADYRDD